MAKVLGICGSLREGSFNRMAMNVAQGLIEAAGSEFVEFDLRAQELPFYNQDIDDAGAPQIVKDLYQAIDQADVVMFASPEYNHSVSGVLKNAIDWASRDGNHLDGKWVMMFGASMGSFGSVRGQDDLKRILIGVNARFLPSPQVMIGTAHEAFNQDGSFKDPKTAEFLSNLINATLEAAK